MTTFDSELVRVLEFVENSYFNHRPIDVIKAELDDVRADAFNKWCGQPRCPEEWAQYYSDWRLVDSVEEELRIAEKAVADSKKDATK